MAVVSLTAHGKPSLEEHSRGIFLQHRCQLPERLALA